MLLPTLKVLDKWHGKHNIKWVYSSDPRFHDLTEFLKWVLEHQPDYNGVELVHEEKKDTEESLDIWDWNGILHRHPRLEHKNNIPEDHVVVDLDEWRHVRQFLFEQGVINDRKKVSTKIRFFC